MPAKYVRPCSKGQKNDFRDATHDRTIQLGHTLRSNGRPLLPAKQTSSEQGRGSVLGQKQSSRSHFSSFRSDWCGGLKRSTLQTQAN